MIEMKRTFRDVTEISVTTRLLVVDCPYVGDHERQVYRKSRPAKVLGSRTLQRVSARVEVCHEH